MYCRRACDSCRQRKVKCNGTTPCSSCSTSQLSCIYGHSAKRRGPRVSKRIPRFDDCQPEKNSRHERHITIATNASISTESETTSHERLELDEHGVACSIGVEEAAPLCQHSPARQQLYDSRAVPGNLASSPSPSPVADLGFGYRSGDIHTWLVSSVETVLAMGDPASTSTIHDIAHHCIDLFFQYMFPSTPITHRGMLRDAALVFLPDSHHGLSEKDSLPYHHATIAYAKSFTLITALCAFVTSVMPGSLLPNAHLLAGLFSQSSRAMLKSYEHYDLEHPDSTSLTIRIWQSGALQNSTGRRECAWHIHSEASLLALRLRLYEETAIRRDSALESRLLRMNFWLLYSADKAAAALESRLAVLSEPLFESDLTLLENADDEEPLLDQASIGVQGVLERRIIAGFHLKTQIWAAGARVVNEIKFFVRRQKRPGWVAENRDTDMMLISQANIEFSTSIHNLPTWLQRPDVVEKDHVDTANYQRTCFWVQRSNIMTAYHCLRLIILQKCIENDMVDVLGLSEHPLSSAMRKTEIAQNFINELQNVPFVCYKVQGEAGVERIRHVASILLELVHSVENDTLKDGVQSQLEYLLDFLARLDSKASDTLSKRQQYASK